jgi:hypothetical protein
METLHFYSKANEQGPRMAITGIINNNTLCIGVAVCSNKDNFRKVKGRGLSLSRALSENPNRRIHVMGKEHDLRKIFVAEATNIVEYVRNTGDKTAARPRPAVRQAENQA